MKEEILEEIGFSKNEAKVYISLLEAGPSTATLISEKSKVHRTNVYDALERLTKKSLVSYFVKEEKKLYEATNPENILEMIKEKESKLQELLPQLILKHQLAKKAKVRVYEGLTAARLTLNNFLKYKKPIYALGTPKQASRLVGPFLENFHKRRIAAKIVMKHIYNKDTQERIHYLNNLPYTEARFLDYNAPVATTICNNEVILKIWTDTPLVIQIESREIADAYRSYFDLMWNLAKKPSKS